MSISLQYEGFKQSLRLPSSFSVPKQMSFLTTARQDELTPFTNIQGYDNIVVIGQGGSVNSIRALAAALPARSDIHIVDSQDPFFLQSLKEKTKYSCLVIVISKSGNTLSVIENAAYFNGLPMLMITERKGALHAIAQAANIRVAEHPAVGGRFIGNTLACLLPAFLAGMDTSAIIRGAQECYALAHSTDLTTNHALCAALCMFEAEQDGFTDVFLPIYDARLAGAKECIMQLCHETFGKHGHGQTILAMGAPESQHHTDQRYFGGPRNMLGFFMSVAHYPIDSKIFIPENWRGVQISGKSLGCLHGLSHADALHAELAGVLAHARKERMPFVYLSVDTVDAYHMGYVMAFWQLVAVYSAVLRGVDPFDQPEVEYAKNMTREMLLK